MEFEFMYWKYRLASSVVDRHGYCRVYLYTNFINDNGGRISFKFYSGTPTLNEEFRLSKGMLFLALRSRLEDAMYWLESDTFEDYCDALCLDPEDLKSLRMYRGCFKAYTQFMDAVPVSELYRLFTFLTMRVEEYCLIHRPKFGSQRLIRR